MAVAVLAISGNSRLWCRGCNNLSHHRMVDRYHVMCLKGHKQHALTHGLALSIDDDEIPPRLVPPKEYR